MKGQVESSSDAEVYTDDGHDDDYEKDCIWKTFIRFTEKCV